MATDRPGLNDLRREIDAIDDAIHDQLMRRGDLQAEIGRAKGESEVYIRPGREAMVLRRLIARHEGRFPKAVLVRIWREIFAAGLSLQNDFSVASLSGAGQVPVRALARDHFGSLTPIQEMASAQRVLQAVSEGAATVGVLPMPVSEEKDPWWRRLSRQGERSPRIIARLPFAAPISTAGQWEALAVGLAPPEDTGRDRSYVIVDTGSGTSRSALKRTIEAAGLHVLDWKYCAGRDGASYLVEVDGFVPEDDPRVAGLPETSGGALLSAWRAGGYAVPLQADELG
jgi:chorismate mutase